VFSRTGVALVWRELARTIGKGAIATAAMSLGVLLLGYLAPADLSRPQLAVQLVLAIGTGAAVYASVAWLLRMPELGLLLRRGTSDADRLSQAGGARS